MLSVSNGDRMGRTEQNILDVICEPSLVAIRIEAYENSCLKLTRWDANPGDANATSKGSQECVMFYGTAILIEE